MSSHTRPRVIKQKPIKTIEMELALFSFFDSRMRVIVPNVSYGMFSHELDLFMLTNSNYGIEIEIKIDKYDLIKDKEKRHGHKSKKLKHLYFAVPNYLVQYQEHIPLRAGIISVTREKNDYLQVEIIKKPQATSAYQFTDLECYKIVRLASYRLWKHKRELWELKNK
jgi:hypothetical protein